MIRTFILFIWAFVFCFPVFGEVSCENEFETALFELLEADQDNIVGQLTALTLTKLAAEVRFENKTTFEDYSKSWHGRQARELRLANEQIVSQVEALYQNYGFESDLNSLDETIRAANPWSASLRLQNRDLSKLIVLQTVLNPSGPFDQTDAALLWIMEQISQQVEALSPRGTAAHNQSLVSWKLNQLLESPLSAHEILGQATPLLNSTTEFFESFQNDFLEEFSEICGPWFHHQRCFSENFLFDDILPKVLFDLADAMQEPSSQLMIADLRAEYPLGLRLNSLTLNFSPHSHRRQVPPEQMNLDFTRVPNLVVGPESRLQLNQMMSLQEEFLGLESEVEKLHFFQTHLSRSENSLYGILDRRQQKLKIYQDGEEIASLSLENARSETDEYRNGGAGLYRFSYLNLPILYLTDERERNTGFRLRTTTPENLEKLKSVSTIYVLPVEEGHHFRLKDGRMIFTHEKRKDETAAYNFTPRRVEYRPLTTVITDPALRNPVSIEFVATLDREKEKLMEIYKLENDDYNELARLSFGILGNESQFGQSQRYWIKEQFPWLVALLKGEGFDTSANSRGPTQIKTVPRLIAENFGVTKDSLIKPEHSAVATLGFLAEALNELKVRERNHPDITPYNRFEYLHYIYTGRHLEINRGTATPEQNIYYRNMRAAAGQLEQTELLTN